MNKFYLLLAVLILFVISFSGFFGFVEAQSTAITKSHTMNDVRFDGKWTFTQEWKASALEEIRTDTGYIYVRTAHQDEFIYVMLDAVFDNTLDSKKDWAMVCFNTIYENTTFTVNKFCFKSMLNDKEPITFEGNGESENFRIVDNHPDYIGVGTSSDENDRYSDTPHASYEFRIPLELLQRSYQYNFLIGVYDSSKSQLYTWPDNIDEDLINEIPSTEKWGIIYSPDKSLPEYELPLFVLASAILPIILATSIYRKNLFSLYK